MSPLLQNPKRILAIDYGSRRLGVAISDPMNIIAQGLPTLVNDQRVFEQLRVIIRDHPIGCIVVGMPYNLKGESGMKAKEVEEFIERLRTEVEVPVTTWDERFTSKLAQDAMREMGTKKMKRRRKGAVDQMASVLLLQSYLDRRKD
ncbi:MAG: Holliday junction resolvase RuvX [Bacteroidota bacterium]